MSTVSENTSFDREKWLQERRLAVGASDVVAILGVSPYQSPWDVWAEKTGRLEPWLGNEATRLGQHFEKGVLDVAEERLGPLVRNKRIIHPVLPIASTLDAQCIGSKRPVEAKTSGLVGPLYGNWGAPGTDEVPENYLVQVHTQLLCTGADLGYLFALLPGRGVVQFEINRSDKVCEQLGSLLNDWWTKHIVQGVEPSREKASLEVVKRMRRVGSKEVAVASDLCKAVDRFEKAKRVMKRAEQIKEKYESLMLVALGDAEVGTLDDGRSYSYFEQTRGAYSVQEAKYRVLRVRKAKK